MLLHSKIKDLLIEKVPNITKFLKDMELPLSYLGIRYFLSGKQDKIGEKGLEKIIDKLGYQMVLVPVKLDNDEDLKIATDLQNKFIDDFDIYLNRFSADRRTIRRRSRDESQPMAIEGILTGLDTSAPVAAIQNENTNSNEESKNSSGSASQSIEVDLGITVDDLF
jgi:hypothetical protein